MILYMNTVKTTGLYYTHSQNSQNNEEAHQYFKHFIHFGALLFRILGIHTFTRSRFHTDRFIPMVHHVSGVLETQLLRCSRLSPAGS